MRELRGAVEGMEGSSGADVSVTGALGSDGGAVDIVGGVVCGVAGADGEAAAADVRLGNSAGGG